MLRNYLKIMFRTFLKRKVFTFINLLGLSSPGCDAAKYHADFIPGFFNIGHDRFIDRLSAGLVDHVQLAAEFFVSDRDILVGFYYRRSRRYPDCAGHH
jgi:hypothetical protein